MSEGPAVTPHPTKELRNALSGCICYLACLFAFPEVAESAAEAWYSEFPIRWLRRPSRCGSSRITTCERDLRRFRTQSIPTPQWCCRRRRRTARRLWQVMDQLRYWVPHRAFGDSPGAERPSGHGIASILQRVSCFAECESPQDPLSHAIRWLCQPSAVTADANVGTSRLRARTKKEIKQ